MLKVYADYSRETVHNLFSSGTEFRPQRGAWGIHGIVRIPSRPGDFVFFVTFGQSQSGHNFEESVTENGVLAWQSQPSMSLENRRIRQFIEHDEHSNSIYLFLRTRGDRDYTYLGRLAYLNHDIERERPVWFRWQILDWNVNNSELARIGLVLSDDGDVSSPAPPGITDTAVPRLDRKTGITTGAFRSRQGRNYPEEAERNGKLGSDGEDMVVREERKHLNAKGFLDLAGRVRNIARSEGDGAGYDVLSFMPSGEEKHIEVKTTKGGRDTPFYITPNELAFSACHPDSYELHRLYNFSESSAYRYILRGDISSQLELKPTQYRAHLLADAAHPRD